ncbi:MAG: fatty acid oxidation complex subunit alpha FadJ [Acidobacteria bacterium]|nr:MAG: fatty acid oxidation complex subunit alpha FadJ [Acidobacteriota bacterium]
MTDNATKEGAGAGAAPGRIKLEDGVAWVHLDDPEKNVNTLSTRYFAWFEQQIQQLAGEDLRGLVFVSDKPGYFIVGADIAELEAFTDRAAVIAMIERGHRLVGRFAQLPFPVVAAIDGACLGGGLELALACDRRLATTAPHTKLGLPEVQLGLIPGLGGTQRLPRLIGVPEALDLILTGKQIPAKKAKKLGLVDQLCDPLALREAALELVSWGKPSRTLRPRKRPSRSLFSRVSDLVARTPGAKNLVYEAARKKVLKRSGGHYPAPLKAIDVVREGMTLPLDEALRLEAAAFAELVTSDVAKALISIFFTKNEVEGRARKLAEDARPVERIGVLGAGFMGAGIAQVLAYKGYTVVLKDRDHKALGRGLKQCHDLFRGLAKRRRMTPVEVKEAMSRLRPTIDYRGFGRVPFVIEAVFEDVGVKHAVIRETEAAGPDDLIFASNTSTIPIARLAEASKRPENVIGMHFFSPVHKMPLLEIIRHPKTSAEALATTVEIGRRMGKTVIVVGDGPGFFTSRVLGPMLNEAAWCLAQGARIDQIDRAMTRWGWPVGPMALLDEVGIDIAFHAGKVMAEHAGDRADTSPILGLMIEAERLGRKVGKGFYDYRKKPKRVAREVYELIDWEEGEVDDDEIVERCWMQMLNETARCMEDGVIENPNDVEIGVIFGFGFPPFRGGILREADRLGLDYVVGRLEAYAARYGKRLEPAQLLRDMAKKGRRFHRR